MKYPHGFVVTIPYIDSDGSWTRTLISTNDPIDHRHIKRGIRKWIKQNIGRSVADIELRLLLKKVQKHKQAMMYVPQRFKVKDGDFASLDS